ncbi:MAG: TVP38/TMEM64 family protein [Tissierellia bacterium]|nr:TVP38/TMEM64 family protein [Tissierellia bacterium]
MNKKGILKKILLMIAIISLSVFVYIKFDFKNLSPSIFSDKIRSMGKLSAVFYIIILTLLPLLLFPDSVLVIAGGMVFGLKWGSILTSIGSLIGALIAYYIAKYLGRDAVEKFIKKDPVMIKSGKSGFILILILRLIPLFPFKLVSYSAGLAEVDIKEFSLATFIGSMPGILVYVNLGDKSNNIGSSEFYMAILILVLMTALFYIFKKWYDKKMPEKFSKPEEI